MSKTYSKTKLENAIDLLLPELVDAPNITIIQKMNIIYRKEFLGEYDVTNFDQQLALSTVRTAARDLEKHGQFQYVEDAEHKTVETVLYRHKTVQQMMEEYDEDNWGCE